MKRKIPLVACALALLAAPPLRAASTENIIIFDTFGTGKQQVDSREPDKANLPGGKWYEFRDDYNEDAWTVTGIIKVAQKSRNYLMGHKHTLQDIQNWIDTWPDSVLWLPTQVNGSALLAIPIASNGGYQKPKQFTISADLGGFQQANIALGFFPSEPPREKNFYIPYDANAKLMGKYTGLIFTCWNHPMIQHPGMKGATDVLPEVPDQFGFVAHDPFDLEGAPNGALTLFENGKAVITVKYTGAFDPAKPHRLTYDVDTTTGAISSVKLEGSASDYSKFRSKAFTDAATAYAAVGDSHAPEGTPSQTPPHLATWAYVCNFRIGVNLDPALPLGATKKASLSAAMPPAK